MIRFAFAACLLCAAARDPALVLQDGVGPLAFSPDGRRLAAWFGRGVNVWDLESGKRTLRLEGGRDQFAAGLAFSPDGAGLAVAAYEVVGLEERLRRPPKGELAVWDLAGPKRRLLLENPHGPVLSPAFSADGAAVAALWQDKHGSARLRLHDPKAGRELAAAHWHDGWRAPAPVAFAGGLILSGGGDGVRAWGAARAAPGWHAKVGDALALSAAAGRAAVLARVKEVRVLLIDLETGKTLWGREADAGAVALSPDGRSLAVADAATGVVGIWDASTGKERGFWAAHDDAVLALAYSPDGRRLATAGGGVVKVWDVPKLP